MGVNDYFGHTKKACHFNTMYLILSSYGKFQDHSSSIPIGQFGEKSLHQTRVQIIERAGKMLKSDHSLTNNATDFVTR